MIWVLSDFGSTFTKVALVEGGTGSLLATAQHPTTIDSDVVEGYVCARDEALARAGLQGADRSLAASSAAGGLRMAAVGLVDDLTADAARRAALSAGARVERVWSGLLGDDAQRELREQSPDVILFAGGTDGGERRRVLSNAAAVAAARTGAAVVIACNAAIAREVAREFEAADHETVVVDNVLPTVHREHSDPARAAIREIFIRRVVRAKGLSRADAFFESMLMPSPAAVLAGAELIADGAPGETGAGGIAVVDVGGATTDVHSVMRRPVDDAVVRRVGPPAPESARTVEGDLGVRWNADAVVALDRRWLGEYLETSDEELVAAARTRTGDPRFLPTTDGERRIDLALATSCVALATERHVGRLMTTYVPGEGADVVLDGRDLREIPALIATGGSLVLAGDDAAVAVRLAMGRLDHVHPAPRAANILIDRRYVLAAAGLLSTVDPAAAVRLLRAEIPGLEEVMIG